ncbi:MAG TPA: hypothetical protein VK673_08905, partial [Chthoniobacterales bacterium]|nr:hypothetical protein [Chthoniobacterales bacterium]
MRGIAVGYVSGTLHPNQDTPGSVESRSDAVAEAPFSDPAHQTGRADFPHPAFGQGLCSFRPRQISAEA